MSSIATMLNTVSGWLPAFSDGFLVTLALVGMCLPFAFVCGMLLVRRPSNRTLMGVFAVFVAWMAPAH